MDKEILITVTERNNGLFEATDSQTFDVQGTGREWMQQRLDTETANLRKSLCWMDQGVLKTPIIRVLGFDNHQQSPPPPEYVSTDQQK